MDFIFKETKLSDGSKVHDIQLVANGKSSINGKSICIFSCISEGNAISFLRGLEELVAAHTLESLDEVNI